jgi:GTPase SAR1 family protein
MTKGQSMTIASVAQSTSWKPNTQTFEHSITWEDDVWRVDPFDVEEVHKTARVKFNEILDSVTLAPHRVQSRIMLFHGQSGAGKTHLIRALRTSSHLTSRAYFGYAQMTPDVTNYADYYLRRLINALEKPYDPVEFGESGLLRMSNRLVSEAELIEHDQVEELRNGDFSNDELGELVMEMADDIVSSHPFLEEDLDINLVRALLYLQRNDPRIDQRVRQFLYGTALTSRSQQMVTALESKTSQDRAFELIESIGKITYATEGSPLVFCIDQVEDLRFFDDPEERFQKAIRDLIQIANRVSSSIILISCLDDFYFQMRQFLPQSFIDRIEKTAPVLLGEMCSADEAKMILNRRISQAFARQKSGGTPPRAEDIFGETFFHEVAGLPTRRLLEASQTRWLELCGDRPIAAEEHDAVISATQPLTPAKVSPLVEARQNAAEDLNQLWEKFTFDHQPEIPAEEGDLMTVLASALTMARDECETGIEIEIEPIGWIEEVSAIDVIVRQSGGSKEHSRLFMCNRSSQGGGLRRQMERVMASTQGRKPVVLRASDFPPNAKSSTAVAVRQYLQSGGNRLVIPIYEWERMIMVRDFREKYHRDPSIKTWTQAVRPLRDLPSIRMLLGLSHGDDSSVTMLHNQLTGGASTAPNLELITDDQKQNEQRQEEHAPYTLNPAGEGAAAISSEPVGDMPPGVIPGVLRLGSSLRNQAELANLDKSLLRRHAAVLGGSGSGKTTLALSIIEQLLMQDTPAVLIDRKGDLCSYANGEVWEDDPNDSEERRQQKAYLRENTDIAVYTPGRTSGRPISITLLPQGMYDLPDHEQQELASVSAAALGEMLHLGISPTHQRYSGILSVALKLLGEFARKEVTLTDLITFMDEDENELTEVISRMDPNGRLRKDLVAQLDSLSHRNYALFDGAGEPLSMDAFLGKGKFKKQGKTKLSIIYTGFLGDNENILFWVAQFLSEALRFCQRNPSDDLQAMVMFDEADLYIPANSKPATKEPLESLLKRARSAGMGIMLATQSPGDLDYKSRDQITSWFIGKVREDTALRKLRAAFSSDSGIDPALVLPNQKVGEFHLIQEGMVKAIKSQRSLVQADQVPFDRIEELGRETLGKDPNSQIGFKF